jgi:hypothetical protein
MVRVVDDVWPSLDVVAFTELEPKKYIVGAKTNPITAIIDTSTSL